VAKLNLTFAASSYDNFRDLTDGTVSAEGIHLNCLRFSIEDTFSRFVNFREWEASEMTSEELFPEEIGIEFQVWC